MATIVGVMVIVVQNEIVDASSNSRQAKFKISKIIKNNKTIKSLKQAKLIKTEKPNKTSEIKKL